MIEFLSPEEQYKQERLLRVMRKQPYSMALGFYYPIRYAIKPLNYSELPSPITFLWFLSAKAQHPISWLTHFWDENSSIEELIELIKTLPNQKITIVNHTDDITAYPAFYDKSLNILPLSIILRDAFPQIRGFHPYDEFPHDLLFSYARCNKCERCFLLANQSEKSVQTATGSQTRSNITAIRFKYVEKSLQHHNLFQLKTDVDDYIDDVLPLIMAASFSRKWTYIHFTNHTSSLVAVETAAETAADAYVDKLQKFLPNYMTVNSIENATSSGNYLDRYRQYICPLCPQNQTI